MTTSTRRPLRICFIGNMNSMPLAYARELRKLGHEVTFIVDAPPSEPLHRPENRYREYADYPAWMRDRPVTVRALKYAFPRLFLRLLLREVREGDYDGVVLSGLNVGLGRFLSPPGFALLAGSDLDVYCDPATANWRLLRRHYGFVSGTLRALLLLRVVAGQREGLRSCDGFNYFPEGINPHAERLLEEIHAGRDPYRLQLRGLDCDRLAYIEPSNRTGSDVKVLIAVRFLWRTPLPPGFSELENKRNDLILKGIALYLRNTEARPQFILVSKGPDVDASKRLAEELGIAAALTWIDEMTPSEILEWYSRADIVFDQLGSHIVGAVALDSMLTGRPVIANARPDVFEAILPEPSPICHAETAEQVADWLARLVDDPRLRREIGRRSHDHVIRFYNQKDTAHAIAQFFTASREGSERASTA